MRFGFKLRHEFKTHSFGTVLTILELNGLIYVPVFFQNFGTAKKLISDGILELVFFFACIGLIRETRDVANS